MKRIDIIRRAASSLRQAKLRTILTSLAISVGAFTIALAMAAGNGGRAYIDTMISTLGSTQSINVAAKQEAQTSANTPKKVNASSQETASTIKYLTEKDRNKIAKIDGVETVSPKYTVQAIGVSHSNGDQYVAAVEVQADDASIDLSAGSLSEGSRIADGTIVLPYKYVEPLGFRSNESALGQKITLSFEDTQRRTFTKDFTITAIDRQPSSPLAFYQDQFRISNNDGRLIAAQQQTESEKNSFYGLAVKTKNGANVEQVRNAIAASGDYEVQTFEEARSSVMNVVNTVQYGLMGFGLLAIIASVFGIINTQYISVLERTRQIGLMKALGMSGNAVGKLFRYEAAWVGLLGGIIGSGFAFLLTLFNPLITQVLHLEGGTRLLQMDWLSTIVLIVGLMIVAIASGYLPSRKAAKLDPIEALRTE